MSYIEEIRSAMNVLGEHPEVVFHGYNVRYGGKAGGSLNGVPEDKLWEAPLCENLMLGACIGFSLDGRIPVCWLERFDFATCFMDALVNHLDKLAKLSDGIHKPAVIIRVCVGNKEAPLFTGATHTQDFTEAIKKMVSFNVVPLLYTETIKTHYEFALGAARNGHSTMLIEFKDRYNQE